MDSVVSPPVVVGTAGHVDHGKSSLVLALTGINPDRLPEERRRGMTIELGFAHLDLGNGHMASFVDVPGHERLVSAMVSGASAIDVSMLVVAADEGVMPQTREHLAILHVLGIRPGLIVVTKCDLVESEFLVLVEEEIREAAQGTSLSAAPLVHSSVRTEHGLQEIKQTIFRLSEKVRPDSLSNPRLVADRVFTKPGFGTVVTGTACGNSFKSGMDVSAYPGGRPARIRGLEQYGIPVSTVDHGRAALNLSGEAVSSIRRGDVIASPHTVLDSRRFDALVTILDNSRSVDTNEEVQVHIGGRTVAGRVYPLASKECSPGEETWCQIRLDEAVPIWRSQRFVLRLPSPLRTIGGGICADVSPKRRSTETDVSTLNRLLESDPRDVVAACLVRGPLTAGALVRLSGYTMDTINETLRQLEETSSIKQLGKRYFAHELMQANESMVQTRLRSIPMAATDPAVHEEIRRSLRLSRDELHELVKSAGHVTKASEIARSLAGSRILTELNRYGFQPPNIEDVLAELGYSRETLAPLERAGLVVRIDSWLFLSPSTAENVIQLVGARLGQGGELTASEIREILGTSRKYAMAYIAWLDAGRITRRVGDLRVAGKNLPKSTTPVSAV